MYEQLNVACLGIIENMSYYICPKCGHRDEVFDHGGAAASARDLGVPFLGEIPLNVKIRVSGDAGTPERMFLDPPDYVQKAIDKVVANTAGQVSIKSTLRMAPTLSIE
jgi:ATP-binding protein involved in chromosome partitioning